MVNQGPPWKIPYVDERDFFQFPSSGSEAGRLRYRDPCFNALLNPSDYLNCALSTKVLVTAAKFTADSGG